MSLPYPKPYNDEERVAFLEGLAILDTAPNQHFDRIVSLCRAIFEVEVATISLVARDRQWFKAVQGMEVCETDRDLAFCNYTILEPAFFEVPDALQDARFAANTLVVGEPHIRYYAGQPLVIDGMALGTLCLIDFVPHPPLDERMRLILEQLAAVVVREIRVQRLIRHVLPQVVDFA